MFLDDVPVSYLAVLLGALAYMVIGAIWYAPFLFGHCRTKHETVNSQESIAEENVYCPLSLFLGESVLALIASYVLDLFIQLSQADEIAEGIVVAIWVWLGFIATTQFSSVLWGGRSFKHFLVHAGFMLIGFMAMGAVITYVELW